MILRKIVFLCLVALIKSNEGIFLIFTNLHQVAVIHAPFNDF